MNIKLSAFLLVLSSVTSLVLIDINPTFAQTVNGSDTGNNTHSIIPTTSGTPSFSPAVQAAIADLIRNLATTSPATFAAISGGSTSSLFAALVPTGFGINPSGMTVQAAFKVISALQAISGDRGIVNPIQVNNAIEAFNDYAKALVAEVGGEKAMKIITNAPGSLRAVLVGLADVAQ